MLLHGSCWGPNQHLGFKKGHPSVSKYKSLCLECISFAHKPIVLWDLLFVRVLQFTHLHFKSVSCGMCKELMGHLHRTAGRAQLDTAELTARKNCCQKGSSNRMLHMYKLSCKCSSAKNIFNWFSTPSLDKDLFLFVTIQICQALHFTDIQNNASWRHNLISPFIYPYFLNYEWLCVYFSLIFHKYLIFILALITFSSSSYNPQLNFSYNLRLTMQLDIISPLIDLEAMQRQSCTFTIPVFL